jgi:hypothetical protein
LFVSDISQKYQEVLDLTTQIDLLTSSLSGSEIASTPISGMLTVTATNLAAAITSAIAHCHTEQISSSDTASDILRSFMRMTARLMTFPTENFCGFPQPP